MNGPLLAWVLLSAIWGSTWLFIKLGLADLPPFTFAGIRFALALLPLLALGLLRRRPLPRDPRDWALMAGTGVLTFTVIYGLIFWGESHISSGLAAILYACTPLFTLLLAHWTVPEEPLTARRLGGVLLGLGGVVVIFYKQIAFGSDAALWGSAAVVLSALVTAANNVLIKRRAGHLDAFTLTAVQMAAGAPPLLLAGALLEGGPWGVHWTPTALGSLLYLAWAGTALPFVVYYWLMKRMAVTHTTLIGLASTLLAVLLGWLVLEETPGWHTLFGGMAILWGLVLTMRQPAGGRAGPRLPRGRAV